MAHTPEYEPDREDATSPVPGLSPRIVGHFVLPGTNEVIDVGRMLARDPQAADKLAQSPGRDAIRVETITGGVPDMSDQLPEGTIIVSP